MLFKQRPIVTNRSLEWYMNMHPSTLRKLKLFAAWSTMAVMFASESALAESDSARIKELEKKLEHSIKLIEELQTKVKQLEQMAGKAAEPKEAKQLNDALATQNARIEGIEQQMSQMDAGLGSRSTTQDGTPLHGFADVGAGWSRLGNLKGFTVGSLDFYLTPQFGDNAKALVELIFEYDEQGNLSTDLERLQLGYTFNDQITAWMGRFHTPYGYWNTAFHHGQQIQTSLSRPRFIEFEDKGGILPAHTVGLWGTGSIKFGNGRLTYDAFLGNSPSITGNTLNMNNSGSRNHNASVGASIGYLFANSWEGLKIGGHWLKGDVADDASPGNVTGVNMLGAYLVYDANDWENIAEYYRFNNDDISGGTGSHYSWAAFMQVGRNFGHWTPYGRVERAVLDQTDNYFSQQSSGRSYSRQALGARYDLNPKAAIKVEVNRTRQSDAPTQDYNEARLQYAIRF